MFGARKIAVMGGGVFRDENSVLLDGTDDYFTKASVSGLPSGDTFSIMAWVKYNSTLGANHFNLWGRDAATDNPTFRINDSNMKLNLLQYGTASKSGNTALTQDVWHHAVAVVDNKACTFYLDGAADSPTRSFSNSFVHANEVTIGKHSSDYGGGHISEVAVYDAALSASQVKTIYNGREPYNHREGILPSNLKGWYRFGDGTEGSSGNTIYDMSSNSNDLALNDSDGSGIAYTGDTP